MALKTRKERPKGFYRMSQRGNIQVTEDERISNSGVRVIPKDKHEGFDITIEREDVVVRGVSGNLLCVIPYCGNTVRIREEAK